MPDHASPKSGPGRNTASLAALLGVLVLAGAAATAFVLHGRVLPGSTLSVSRTQTTSQTDNPLAAQASETASDQDQQQGGPPALVLPDAAASADTAAKAAKLVMAQAAPVAAAPKATSALPSATGQGPQAATPAPAAVSPAAAAAARTLTFGMVAPFTGPSRSLGREMKIGIESAFDQANALGGVHGVTFKLAVADDGYQPSRTADAMNQLLDQQKVFGFIGNVGTPTSAVALPIALKAHKLFFGAFTGAALLRNDPPDRYVFNYRASYGEEMAATVHYLLQVRRLKPNQIAVFAQDDGYGDAGYAGVAKAYRALPGNPLPPPRFNYKRNTIEVEPAVKQLMALHGRIKAVIMIATYRAAARFIGRTKDHFPKMIYTNISFVGSTSLAEELMLLGGKYADGVVVTQVVPAVDAYSTLILKYKSAISTYFPGEAPDYVSLEGYIDAELLLHAIDVDKGPITTDSIVSSLESLHNYDMGLGTPLSFSMDNHQASHKVWGTVIDDKGKFHAIDLN
ncbi:MAG: ABC transporter substrate-binding protein [Hyphomicrobiales bacterium]|nr:ABC transporter substrate-binding protein [Hyphomicrobiales bacterium]